MCIHETTQLTDEHRIIICADCGREFGRLARDEGETLIVPIQSQTVLLIPGSDDLAEWPQVAFAVSYVVDPTPDAGNGDLIDYEPEAHIKVRAVFPCARCGYDGTCPEYEGEPCHT